MSQIADSVTRDALNSAGANALEARILCVMSISIIAAIAVSAVFAPWRSTTGLMLGGALSVFNYRWLHSSVAAVISMNVGAKYPKAGSLRYLLRYLVVFVIVFAAYQLQLISLAATITGLCAFVPALMFEGLREFYFVIVHREEPS